LLFGALGAACGSASSSPSASQAAPAPPAATTEPSSPSVCTSGTTWTNGNQGSPLMNPGRACIACHDGMHGPTFYVAGTVFPTEHEPDGCDGTPSVQVVITDANGKTSTLAPNAAGNFYLTSPVALPFSAKLVAGGKERAMPVPQSDGDCNGCHTEAGAHGAPGRISAP
jgi:hypothetical protein